MYFRLEVVIRMLSWCRKQLKRSNDLFIDNLTRDVTYLYCKRPVCKHACKHACNFTCKQCHATGSSMFRSHDLLGGKITLWIFFTNFHSFEGNACLQCQQTMFIVIMNVSRPGLNKKNMKLTLDIEQKWDLLSNNAESIITRSITCL